MARKHRHYFLTYVCCVSMMCISYKASLFVAPGIRSTSSSDTWETAVTRKMKCLPVEHIQFRGRGVDSNWWDNFVKGAGMGAVMPVSIVAVAIFAQAPANWTAIGSAALLVKSFMALNDHLAAEDNIVVAPDTTALQLPVEAAELEVATAEYMETVDVTAESPPSEGVPDTPLQKLAIPAGQKEQENTVRTLAETGSELGNSSGKVIGSAAGVISGLVAAPFTLGLSIPASVAAGSGVGSNIGATLGGAAGAFVGHARNNAQLAAASMALAATENFFEEVGKHIEGPKNSQNPQNPPNP